MPPSAPKCKVRKTWPAIGPKGCKAKAEEPLLGHVNDMRRHKLNKKVAEIRELNAHTKEIAMVVNIERQATRNAKMAAAALRNKTYQVALEIKAKMKALEQAEIAREGLKKANAAATRAKIIGHIKGARGRKHMAVH
jgi:hypothetical protein